MGEKFVQLIHMERYNPKKIEEKWQKKWFKAKIYEPDFLHAEKPFYNLMMFPYPSAEGLHVGNMYAFTGTDIYGRFKRMQGYDVFEPIGLDGFGIHSENYALKIGTHPVEQAKVSEGNFYRQLEMIGNGFAWRERLETYDPEYYKWTQWIFTEMFTRGLAYRKRSFVNWCVSCKTVLADEQVIAGKCERCATEVIKKELEQWFFRITAYTERMLQNLEKLDWSEKIKIAQKNWIGKSEGAVIKFSVAKKFNYVFLHGYKGSSKNDFWPWLKTELVKEGAEVYAPDLPDTDDPNIREQADFVFRAHDFDENTIIIGHSLGCLVALLLIPKLRSKIAGFIAVAPPMRAEFLDGVKRPALERVMNEFIFDPRVINEKCGRITVFKDMGDDIVPPAHSEELASRLGARFVEVTAERPHFNCAEVPEVLREASRAIEVFTTRPDTLFGVTYMVVAPEHPCVANFELRIANLWEVKKYIQAAKNKSEADRVAENREKTGVELEGVKVINPATGEEIPVFVADYVMGHVGTGAIMAVPAHDERDFEFAKKFGLPMKMVVCPNYPEKICPVLDHAYAGEGHLVDSGKFDGMPSQKAREEIVNFVGAQKKIQYRLRDWLISRQRYWGPPIPMIFCDACVKARRGVRKDMPGWHAVPEKDLPVKLPNIKEFHPTGTDRSPLASVEKFYKVRCPECGSVARRETDVSDTFLDSAWYYLRYLSVKEKKHPWNAEIIKKWFPVASYIGGAEHAVLHLLYVRFLAMVFYDWKLLDSEEPFRRFRAHGLLIKDGAKMSKSRGNVVNPDEYIRAYGADALRMYLMFLGPFEQGGDFQDTGIRGITRFLERVWRSMGSGGDGVRAEEKKTAILHKTIKKVTQDLENLQYNTAVSSLMILLNALEEGGIPVRADVQKIFLKLLAPFAPHITEELWQRCVAGKKFFSIHKEPWPVYNPELIREDTYELVIQINGKFRARITVPHVISEENAKKLACADPRVASYISGAPKKIIFIPGKLINFVV